MNRIWLLVIGIVITTAPAGVAGATPAPSGTVALTVGPDCTITVSATWSGYAGGRDQMELTLDPQDASAGPFLDYTVAPVVGRAGTASHTFLLTPSQTTFTYGGSAILRQSNGFIVTVLHATHLVTASCGTAS